MRLDDARGFVFDLDGTLVRRSAVGVEPMAGAIEVLATIRASERPVVVFTNASHVSPARIAAGVRAGGLELGDDEVLTPVCSALEHLASDHAGKRVLLLGTPEVRERLRDAGIPLAETGAAERAEVVLVFHVDDVSLDEMESAARAILGGASFLTGNYARAYAGADGPILSRGAMVSAAIAKASGQDPTIVGKPSTAAVRAYGHRLAVPPQTAVVVGDDLAMDIALGRLGGSRTVLVRSGIDADLAAVPEAQRPDLVVDGVGDLARFL